MSGINLKSNTYVVTKILKKTQSQVLKDFKVGDLIQFEMEIERTSGASGGGQYASYVLINNITQGISVYKSHSQLLNVLGKIFTIEECQWKDIVKEF